MVVMTKTCDVHGPQSAIVEKDPVHFSNFYRHGTLGKNSTIIINVHDECNMSCPWCYYPMGKKKNKDASYYDSMFNVPYNGYNLLLSGGEPTIRPDYFSFVKELHDYGWNPASITNMVKLADEEFYQKIQTPEFVTGEYIRFAMSFQHPKNYSKEIFKQKLKTLENMETHNQKAMCVMFSITSLDEIKWIREFYMHSRNRYKMLRIRTMFGSWENKGDESQKIFLSELHKAFLEEFGDLNPIQSTETEQSNLYCLYLKMDDGMEVSLSSAPTVENVDSHMCGRPVFMLAEDDRCYPVPIALIVNEGLDHGWSNGFKLKDGG
jgi:MoaA/NifB/PqqE/SkfB family radical SAM enzyme